MKNVLVLLHDDAGQESRFQVAVDVTRAIKGHLICLDIAIMPATAFDRDLGVERVREDANRQKLEPRLIDEGVSWHWVVVEDYVEQAAISASDLADLIVVNSADLGARDVCHNAGRLAAKSGKPVLAVPGRARGFDASGAALVAWDGSDPAAAAVTAAAPLLQLAGSVTLYQVDEVDDGSDNAPAEEAAAYLSRHGIHAEIVRDRAKARMVDDLLLAKAGSGLFSYVVMGAYSRPSMVEALFGGVTRRMLRDSPIPLFLAH